MTVYQVTLKTLSPLHIGDGDELREGFDLHADGKKKISYFLNQDVILDDKKEKLEEGYKRNGRYPKISSLLEPWEFEEKKYVYYQLPGIPSVKKTSFTPVRAFIKNAFRVPYIPGSSVKGAIRTAFGWSAWENSLMIKANPANNREHIDDEIEKSIFGKDPNHDVLRALQVSDFTGKYTPSQIMRVAQVCTWTNRGKGVPVCVEAIKGGVEFTGSIKVDDFLFGQIAEDAGLNFASKKDWIYAFMEKIHLHSISQLQRLADWFEKIPDGKSIASIYRNWSKHISDKQIFMQIGWGTGWDGMTYGSKIQDGDPDEFENIIKAYKLQPTRQKSIRRKPGDFFPESKRVEVKDGKPSNPFGWVQITVEEKNNDDTISK